MASPVTGAPADDSSRGAGQPARPALAVVRSQASDDDADPGRHRLPPAPPGAPDAPVVRSFGSVRLYLCVDAGARGPFGFLVVPRPPDRHLTVVAAPDRPPRCSDDRRGDGDGRDDVGRALSWASTVGFVPAGRSGGTGTASDDEPFEIRLMVGRRGVTGSPRSVNRVTEG